MGEVVSLKEFRERREENGQVASHCDFGGVKLPERPDLSKEERFVEELLATIENNRQGVDPNMDELLRSLRFPPRK